MSAPSLLICSFGPTPLQIGWVQCDPVADAATRQQLATQPFHSHRTGRRGTLTLDAAARGWRPRRRTEHAMDYICMLRHQSVPIGISSHRPPECETASVVVARRR